MRKKEKIQLCGLAAKWTYNGDGNPLQHAQSILDILGIDESDSDMDTALMIRAIGIVVGDRGEPMENAMIDFWVDHGKNAVEEAMMDLTTFRKNLNRTI